MQKAAQEIMEKFDGVFPDNHKDILSLKGIGPYTAGAITSIAFGLPEPAVDGNVMRVMARFLKSIMILVTPKTAKFFKRLWKF